jgi:hypothetical protein
MTGALGCRDEVDTAHTRELHLNGSVRCAHLRMTPSGSRPARKDRHQSSHQRVIAPGQLVSTLTTTTR